MVRTSLYAKEMQSSSSSQSLAQAASLEQPPPGTLEQPSLMSGYWIPSVLLLS